jgi:WD40 repeat protein
MNIWSISSKKIVDKLDYHTKKVQKIVKFDKNQIATCGFDSKIFIYDLQKNLMLYEIRTQTEFIRDFIFVQDSIVCCGDNSKIEIYSYNTSDKSYSDVSVVQLDDNLTKIVSDGSIIIGVGKKVHIIELKTQKILHQVPAHSGSIEDLMMFGHLFLTSGDDKKIKIWNKNGVCLESLIGHKTSVNRIKPLDNQGNLISSSFDNDLFFWYYDIYSKYPYFPQTNRLKNINFNFY